MSDPKQIWLAPTCHEDGDGRQWCQDDVWDDDCGCGIEQHSAVRYVLAADYDAQTKRVAELAGLLREALNEVSPSDLGTSLYERIDAALAGQQQQGESPVDDKSHPRFIAGYIAGLHDRELKATHSEDGPEACLLRHRSLSTPARLAHDNKDCFTEWSEWEPVRISYAESVTDPARNVPPLYELKYLYTRAALATAAVAVVMPERMTIIPEGKTISYAAGYEAALDAVANLNRNTVPLELLERVAAAPFLANLRIAVDELRAILGANCGSIDDLTHDSDCSTNNHGCPDLIGPCDCSLSEGARK